jgi:hypothetical protein
MAQTGSRGKTEIKNVGTLVIKLNSYITRKIMLVFLQCFILIYFLNQLNLSPAKANIYQLNLPAAIPSLF